MSSSEAKIQEFDQDLEELKRLVGQTSRPNNLTFLNSQIDRLNSDLARLRKQEQERLTRLNQNTNTTTTGFTKTIDTYGWDQSDKFVKLYITTLRDADKCKAEDIVTNFQPRSFTLTLRNINSTNYTLEVKTLLNNIDPSGSYVKCKSDIVSIFLKKQETGKSWSVLTEKEAIVKDKPMPKMDENADPQEGLMSMMKKMYEEGDDEMKRTITKAFAESREKSLRGEGLNMDI